MSGGGRLCFFFGGGRHCNGFNDFFISRLSRVFGMETFLLFVGSVVSVNV